MNVEVAIAENDIDAFKRWLLNRFEQAKSPVQQAMGERLFEIVRGNFGNTGVDRPIEWAPLSKSYAKAVGREHATLFLSGKLESSVKQESTDDASRVFVSGDDVPYALAHQYGSTSKNLPARPYFPITESGEPTAFAQAEINEAARQAVARFIGEGIL